MRAPLSRKKVQALKDMLNDGGDDKIHYTPYRGYVIARYTVTNVGGITTPYWRVKLNATDSHACHHGSMDSMKQAKTWVDAHAGNAALRICLPKVRIQLRNNQ